MTPCSHYELLLIMEHISKLYSNAINTYDTSNQPENVPRYVHICDLNWDNAQSDLQCLRTLTLLKR
jgi:hypothetical protein